MHVLVSCCSDQCPVIIQFHIPQVCATQYSVHIPQVATQYARVQDDVWVEAASSKVRLQQAAAGRHGGRRHPRHPRQRATRSTPRRAGGAKPVHRITIVFKYCTHNTRAS